MAKKTLNDKIVANLNKPKSRDYDIEDEEWNGASGRDFSRDSNDEEDEDDDDKFEEEKKAERQHYVSVSKSKLRDNTINMGEKYTGSKVGRKEIFEEEEEEEEESDDDDQQNESEEESDILADVTDSENEDMSEDQIEEEEFEEKEIDDESEGSDSEEEYKRNKITKLLNTEKQQILNRLSTSAKSDALKGYTILEQGSQYDKILDSRIKLQKAIHSGNCLPINSKYFKQNKTKDTNTIISSVEEKLYDLIDKLINVRNEQLVKDGLIKSKININHKKRSLNEMINSNNQIDEVFKPVTKTVLTKWSNRVQSASGVGALNQGKFKVINQSVWMQVKNQLDDVERLVKKTKINRRGVDPIGYKEELKANMGDDDNIDSDDADEDADSKVAGLSNIDKSLQTNEYIFDDDDFYRLLLNDMINKKLDQKQSNSSASILMLSQNKMQKNYDRMATKGRKLKYTVQDPIVQFEIPKRKQYNWNDDQIDELFAGLFGMKFNMTDDEESGDESNIPSEDISTLKESSVKLFG